VTYTASAPNEHEADGGFTITVATPADDSDDGEATYSLGDPASPAIDAEESFPAGSGIATIALTAALTELLTSGRQPTSIRWRVFEPAGGQQAAS
jgi:Immunity protein Imm1